MQVGWPDGRLRLGFDDGPDRAEPRAARATLAARARRARAGRRPGRAAAGRQGRGRDRGDPRRCRDRRRRVPLARSRARAWPGPPSVRWRVAMERGHAGLRRRRALASRRSSPRRRTAPCRTPSPPAMPRSRATRWSCRLRLPWSTPTARTARGRLRPATSTTRRASATSWCARAQEARSEAVRAGRRVPRRWTRSRVS